MSKDSNNQLDRMEKKIDRLEDLMTNLNNIVDTNNRMQEETKSEIIDVNEELSSFYTG